jgi:hypothetical protein
MANKGKATEAARAKKLVAGTVKHLAGVTQVMLEGGTYTPAEVQARLLAFATLRDDVDAAKAVEKAKIAAEETQAPALRSFMLSYETFVKAAYGNQPDVLADFGMEAKKARAPLTVEQKAAAAAKRKATRAARHTMGTQQRKAVKGNVTGVVVTPIVEAKPVEPVTGATATPGNGTPHGA